MALTFGQVDTAARDLSAFFDRTRIPQGVAARMASDIQRDLLGKAVRANPDRLATTTDVALAFGSAITLPAYELVVRGRVNFTDASLDPDPLYFISPGQEHAPLVAFSGYLEGGALWLVGDADDWTGVDDITIWYVAAATDITTESTNLVLPDSAKGAVVSRLAAMFGARVSGLDGVGVDVAGLMALAEREERGWLARLAQERVSRIVNLTTEL